MTLQKNLADAMNALRASRDSSITKFSEELGISRSSTQTILKGTGNPRMDTVQHIADNLGLDPAVLLSGSLSEQQLSFALLLLQSLNCFSKFPKEKQSAFASLFLEMLSLIEHND